MRFITVKLTLSFDRTKKRRNVFQLRILKCTKSEQSLSRAKDGITLSVLQFNSHDLKRPLNEKYSSSTPGLSSKSYFIFHPLLVFWNSTLSKWWTRYRVETPHDLVVGHVFNSQIGLFRVMGFGYALKTYLRCLGGTALRTSGKSLDCDRTRTTSQWSLRRPHALPRTGL